MLSDFVLQSNVRKHYLGSSDQNLAKADDLQRWKRSETPPRAKAQADLAIIIIVQFHVYALKVYVRRKKKHPACSMQSPSMVSLINFKQLFFIFNRSWTI